MSFDWWDLLVLAELDPSFPSDLDEAWARAAASRAYYSAFLTCREYCEARLNDDFVKYRKELERKARTGAQKFPGAHEVVIGFLKAQPNRLLSKVAVALDDAKTVRRYADYDRLAPGNPSEWREKAVARARQIRTIMSKLS